MGLFDASGDLSAIRLDTRIRDWVLLPIFFVMIMQGLLRQYISKYFASRPRPKVEQLKRTVALQRSATLRANADFLPASAFRMRKCYFLDKVFLAPTEDDPNAPPPNPMQAMQDPSMMMESMKGQMQMIVPQMLLMGWISYFFPGFVLMRLPFGLSDRFKIMLQRGINLASLDVSYVSSLSWYFLCVFGLRGLYSLMMGSAGAASVSMDQSRMMQQQMQAQAMQPQDPAKVNKAERTELEIRDHQWCVPQAEERLLF